MASLTIRPGSRIRLKGQATHIPDFLVVRCDRDHCWVRQDDWNSEVELNVRFNQIWIPDAKGEPEPSVPALSSPDRSSPDRSSPDRSSNVIYLEDYRQCRAR
jgi:hypothetical protein